MWRCLRTGRWQGTKSVNDFAWRAAASTVAMRPGRHFAQFTVLQGWYMLFGVIQAGHGGWREGRTMNANNVDGHCFYGTADGWRHPGNLD